MAKKFLHRCIGTHARVPVHFLRRVCMHSGRCFEHHACAEVYIKQEFKLWHQRTHLRTCSLQGVHIRSCMCSLFTQLGERGWGGSASLCEHLLLGVGAYSWQNWGEIGVLSVFPLFLTRVGVYMFVCVCLCAHTHTMQIWGTRLWAQGSGWDTWRARRIQMDLNSAYMYSYICTEYTCVCIC